MEKNNLNLDHKIENAKSHFGTIILTLLSIIIGVSLEHLLGKLFEQPISYYTSKYWIAIYGLNSFLILFLIWFDYLWAILFFQWNIRFRDSFLLFLIIVPQIYSFSNLDKPHNWTIAIIFTAIIGALAYQNTYQHINLSIFKFSEKSDEILDKKAMEFVLGHQKICKYSIYFSAISSFIFLIFLKYEVISNFIYPIFLLVFLFLKLRLSAKFVKMLYMKETEVLILKNLFSPKKLYEKI